MRSKKLPGNGNLLRQDEPCNKDLLIPATVLPGPTQTNVQELYPLKDLNQAKRTRVSAQPDIESRGETSPESSKPEAPTSMSVAEFVHRRFASDYVSLKRSAGRAHFQAILKHIITPEAVERAFRIDAKSSKVRLKSIPGWPYLDSVPLGDVSTERVQILISTALEHGYSAQTVIHIRNVLRVIFSHARQTNCLAGENPARHAVPPGMARKQAHTLTLVQLKQVLQAMRYPEREIALFAVLTPMSVAEICGLQWKYVNLLDFPSSMDGGWIPAKAIAVRYQSYRCEFGLVTPNRMRILPIPELLCSALRVLLNRKSFTEPDDFVVTSRSGTPVCPENIAARRLKSISRSLGMPWLSWRVFHRTHGIMNSELGMQLNHELNFGLDLQMPAHRPGSYTWSHRQSNKYTSRPETEI